MKKTGLTFITLVLFALAGCGGSGGGGTSCDVGAQTGCDAGQVCASVSKATTACFDPILVRGQVIDLADSSPVEGARVVALDVNGAPISTVAITDVDGNYELEIGTTRNEDGSPAGDSFTLRADAATYQTFPAGIRQPIPINTLIAVEDAGQFVVESSLTTIGLVALPGGAGTGAIFGTVELPDSSSGALVVAELSPTEGYTAIADRNGAYKIFNLPAGTYSVVAYAVGANYDAATPMLAVGEELEVNLLLNGAATATLSGSVQIVNPGAGDGTSVILVVASTFNDVLVRGETPPGLRAPTGVVPDITGAFTIDGIPAGTYVILAAFENDFLVRDPDTCISGTDIITRTFAAGEMVDLASGFKITGSLDVIMPGATEPEVVTTTTPTFTWADDSSETEYRLTVFDTFGTIVWETTVPGVSGTDPSVTYNADGTGAGMAIPLEVGQFYQFRVVSAKTTGSKTCELSQTEDLKGVFFVQ